MKKQRGITLVEVSLALAILGLIVVLVWQVLGYSAQQRRAYQERDLLVRADDAVVGFVLSHSRLPCPASSVDGQEDCVSSSGPVPTQVGRLPWRTIGLPDSRASQLQYGVLRRPSTDRTIDADFAVARQRFSPLTTSAPMLRPVGSFNALDICHAVRIAAGQSFDPGFLHTTNATGGRQVAYALAAPGALDADGDGKPFDGVQAGSSTGFESPGRGAAPNYDDRVVAVGFDQLWGRLGCGEALAAAGHAHYNAAVAAEMLRESSAHYLKLLKLGVKMAKAGHLSAQATLASSYAGVSKASTTALTALAKTFLSMGATSPLLVVALAAVAANAGSIVASHIAERLAASTLAEAEARVPEGQAVLDQAILLAEDIARNAKAGISAGLY